MRIGPVVCRPQEGNTSTGSPLRTDNPARRPPRRKRFRGVGGLAFGREAEGSAEAAASPAILATCRGASPFSSLVQAQGSPRVRFTQVGCPARLDLGLEVGFAQGVQKIIRSVNQERRFAPRFEAVPRGSLFCK